MATQQALSPGVSKPWLAQYTGILSLLLAGFVVGHALASYAPTVPWGWVAGLLVVLLLRMGVALQGKCPWPAGSPLWRIMATLVLLLLGWLHGYTRLQATVALPFQQPITGTVVGQVRPFPAGWVLETPAGYRLLIRQTTPPPLAGSTVIVQGRVDPPRQPWFPGDFHEPRYLASHGLHGHLRRITQVQILQEHPAHPWHRVERWVDAARNRVVRLFQRSLAPPYDALLGGLVLGDRAISVPTDVKNAFRQTGLVHFLAASGMNVGVVAGLLLMAGRWLHLPRHLTLGLAMTAVAVYALMTGLPPSIQRAGLMLEIALLLKWWQRQLPPVILLLVALVVLLALMPTAIYSLGLQLSVLTTLGIMAYTPGLVAGLQPWLTQLGAGLVVVPLAAQLWAWPLIATTFNQLPLLALPLNIVAALLVTVMTALGFTAFTLQWLWEPAAEALAALAQPFAAVLLALVKWGHAQQAWLLAIPSPPTWTVLGLYAALAVPVLVYARIWRPENARAVVRSMCGLVLLAVGPWLVPQAAQTGVQWHQVPVGFTQSVAVLHWPQRRQTWVLVPYPRLGYWEGRNLATYLQKYGLNQGPLALLSAAPLEQPGLAYLLSEQPVTLVAHTALPVEATPLPSTMPPSPGFKRLLLQDQDRLTLGPGLWVQPTLTDWPRWRGLVVHWPGGRALIGPYDGVAQQDATLAWVWSVSGKNWLQQAVVLQRNHSGLVPQWTEASGHRVWQIVP